MPLHIVLLAAFIFSAIVFGAVFKEAIEDWDNGKDLIFWLPGLIVGGFFLCDFRDRYCCVELVNYFGFGMGLRRNDIL